MLRMWKIRVIALFYGVFLCGYAGHANAIALTYNNLKPQVLTTVLFTGDYSFEITNNTGQTWTDFHFELQQLLIPPVIFGADPYTGPGNASISQDNNGRNTILDVTGLNIFSGQDYDFTLGLVTVEGSAGLVGYPTIASLGPTQVPVPHTLALFMLGLIGSSIFRRRDC